MNRDQFKKQRKPFSFDKQLELKLNSIKNDPKMKSHSKSSHKRQMVGLLDDVTHELQLQEPTIGGSMLPFQSKKSKLNFQIQQLEELQIKEESSIEEQEKKLNVFQIKTRKNKQNQIGNHIWNLVSQIEVATFLQDNFSQLRQEDTIPISHFISKALLYYTGLNAQRQQINKMRQKIKNDLTTTDPQTISLNALQILIKKISIQFYIIQTYIQAKTKLNLSDINKKSKKITQEVTNRMDSLSHKEQEIQYKINQLFKRQDNVLGKQKMLAVKQKDMIIRQKEFKKSFEEKSMKLYEVNLQQFGENVRQTQKKMVQLQKNIKNKIDILQRRSQTLKILIDEHKSLKNKKIMADSQAKIKLRRIQKESETMQKKYKGQIQQLKKQQKELMKSISQLEEKMTKSEKKMKKYKQKMEEYENDMITLRQKNVLIDQQNVLLNQTVTQLRIKIPEQNVMKGVKIKQVTSRSMKSKNKKHQQNDLYSIIDLYQTILASLNSPQQNNTSNIFLTQKMKEKMPLLLGLLCSDDQNQTQNIKPFYLVLHLNKLAISERLRNLAKKIQRKEVERLWSNQLAELLELPFAPSTNYSLFLYLIPILNWYYPTACTFFKQSINRAIQLIQNTTTLNKQTISQHHQKLTVSPNFLQYLIRCFVSHLSQQIQRINQHKQQISVSLGLVSSVVDLLISVSSEKDLRHTLTQLCMCEPLLILFKSLSSCIVSIYNNHSKTSHPHTQIVFTNLQQIEQLTQKLSILIQRTIYHSNLTTLSQLDIIPLKTLYHQLEQINHSNGNRHYLILANCNSILKCFEQN